MSAPEEDEMETSQTAGYVLLGVAALGVTYVLCLAAPRVMTLILWGLGWTGLILGWRKMRSTRYPAPPAPPERGSEKEPQVRIVKDPEHPNRWIVLPEKEAGTE